MVGYATSYGAVQRAMLRRYGYTWMKVLLGMEGGTENEPDPRAGSARRAAASGTKEERTSSLALQKCG